MQVSLHMVFVDDETELFELMAVLLEDDIENGTINLTCSESAEKCLEYLDTENGADVVLIVSDINMPGMSGLDLLSVVKEQFKQIEVYMCSAYDTEEYTQRAKELGASRYLVKPLDIELLKQYIEESFKISLVS